MIIQESLLSDWHYKELFLLSYLYMSAQKLPRDFDVAVRQWKEGGGALCI